MKWDIGDGIVMNAKVTRKFSSVHNGKRCCTLVLYMEHVFGTLQKQVLMAGIEEGYLCSSKSGSPNKNVVSFHSENWTNFEVVREWLESGLHVLPGQ